MTPVTNLLPVSTTPVATLPPVLTTPAENFATSTAGVVDIGGQQFCMQISTGINNTGSKFATVMDTNQIADTLK
jgi:hypothetical protein